MFQNGKVSDENFRFLNHFQLHPPLHQVIHIGAQEHPIPCLLSTALGAVCSIFHTDADLISNYLETSVAEFSIKRTFKSPISCDRDIRCVIACIWILVTKSEINLSFLFSSAPTRFRKVRRGYEDQNSSEHHQLLLAAHFFSS